MRDNRKGITWTGFIESLSLKNKIKDYIEDVDRYNHRALKITSTIGLACCVVLLIFSMPFIGVLKLTMPYALLTAFFGTIFVLSQTVLEKHKNMAITLHYILTFTVVSVSIYMGTVAGTNSNATTFLLFLLLMPMFAIDRPWRLILLNVIMSVLFCIIDINVKEGQLLSLDLSNTAVVCCISAIFIVFSIRRNLDNFELVRSQKEKTSEKDFLINAIPVGVAIYEIKGRDIQQVFTNDEFYRLFQDTREARAERTSGNFLKSIYPEDRKMLVDGMKSVIDGADKLVMACRSATGNGSFLWVRFAASVAMREQDYIEVFCTYSSIEEEIRSKQASEAKTAFLSRMSHDIRTPMNAIMGMTNLAKNEKSIEKIQEYLNYIDHSSTFLLGLINDILDLSKIESGEFTLNPEPYFLSDFDTDVVSIIEPLMKKKNINFIYNMDRSFSCIMTDKLRLNQIFFNLLSNASKFTNPGGTVEMSSKPLFLRDGKQGIRFTVKDNGIGMSEEFQKIMFTPFVQDSYHSDRTEGGTGLGLPIVKSIVEAMSGNINVKSELNSGTEITVDLFVEIPDISDKKSDNDKKEISLNGANILLAEDNNLNILVSKRLLESKGCRVRIVRNGKDCVGEFLGSEPYSFNAILMDVRMPEMDGIEATRQIRKMNRDDAKTIPIIAMTADAFTEERKKTIDAGMNDHLTKPVEPEILFKTLEKYILK